GDLFSDRVYVFTPKGDVFELPKGSVPLDMAYSIHTEIGHHTTGAKVNGKIVPLNYQIKNGDIVDILTSQNSAGPSQDWLDLVHTNKARNTIRRLFTQRDRNENIDTGQNILQDALTDAGFDPHEVLNEQNIARVLEKKHFKTADDLYAAIGFGELTPIGVVNVLVENIRQEQEEKRRQQQEKELLQEHKEINNDNKSNPKAKKKTGKDDSVVIEGIDNMLVRLS